MQERTAEIPWLLRDSERADVTHKNELSLYRFRSKQNEQSPPEYATYSDFCHTLMNDLTPLYLLAFLLTGNHEEAEQCFVATVGDATGANCVFKGCERYWTRRCLIMNAIHQVFDAQASGGARSDSWCDTNSKSRGCSALDTLARLVPPLQRFVFVMSVLEQYSDHECSVLLGRTRRDVSEARVYASRQLSGFGHAFAKGPKPNAA
jgi:hypothetical protein